MKKNENISTEEELEIRKQDFIRKSKEKWGQDTFDYSKVDYIDAKTSVTLICKKHNIEFNQKPNNHLSLSCSSSPCPICSEEIRDLNLSKKRQERDIISEFKKIHGDKYDYSKVDLDDAIRNNGGKIIIICPEHGEFQMNYNSHLGGRGCLFCTTNRRYRNQEEFIKLAKSLYGNRFSYDKTIYKNSTTPITVTCIKHNCDFNVLPLNFLREGHFSCPMCDERVLDTESFIKRAIELYGPEPYDYSLVEYKKSKLPVKIKCNHCGNYFEIIPDKFLREGTRCPCYTKSKLEELVNSELIKLYQKDDIIRQFKFDDLVYTKQLRFDFYLKTTRVLIECQGLQHFEPIEFFGREEGFKDSQKRDLLKFNYCKENGFNLLYFTTKNIWEKYNQSYFSNDMYYEIDSLINKIKSYEKTE